MKKTVELLSPAGGPESFRAAIENGADAVYMGLNKHNAREMANNFTEEEYISAILYAHVRDVKVYLTLNTLIYDDEMKDVLELITKLYSHGLDAVIVQDIGLAHMLRKIVPNLHIHASTQMSVHNLKQVKFLEEIGFSRVVLARELSLEEIEYICKNTSVEIEVFVHGALCVSYSGQCLMSSMIGLRSGNRGKCAQPCRMKYSLYETSKDSRYKQEKCIEESAYILSKKDIFGIEHIQKLSEIGVKSLKIEGRSKTPEYVSLVTKKYRKYLDKNISEIDQKDKKELMQIFNRDGISTGYLDGVRYKQSITLNSPKNTGLLLGTVMDQRKDYVKVKLEEDISMHDGIEVYSEDYVVSTIVTCIKDEHFTNINRKVEKDNYVWLGDVTRKVKYGSKIYKTSSSELNEELKQTYSTSKFIRKVNINGEITALKNKKLSINITLENGTDMHEEIDYMPEDAKTKAIDKNYIIQAISKTNDTPFVFENLNINLDDNVFIPVSRLNELRRNALEKVYNSFKVELNVSNILGSIDKYLEDEKKNEGNINNTKEAVKEAVFVYKYDSNKDYLSKYESKDITIDRIYLNVADIINREEEIIKKYSDIQVFIYISNIVHKNVDKYISENLEKIINLGCKGFLVGNIGYIKELVDLKKRYDIQLVADYSLNITNSYSAVFMQSHGFDIITPSVELSVGEIQNIAKISRVEIVQDLITVMSSRYCILGSFIADRDNNSKCNMPCIKSKYYLKDSYGLKYNIVCDNIDCTMKLVRTIGDFENVQDVDNLALIRNCEI